MDVHAKLKWGKRSYEVTIHPGTSASDFKSQVQALTGLPPHRQKLLCPKMWRGALKDSDTISTLTEGTATKNLAITLIGSAEILEEKPIEDRPTFLEDMTPDEIKRMEMEQYQQDHGQDDTPTIDIVALQKEPGLDRFDNKIGMHQYNRFVTGLPQHQINSLLKQRKDDSQLHDTLAMSMGLELRKAYVNSLAVLDDGTVVSGLDDGHIQLWSRCQMIQDLKHATESVEHVMKFPSSTSDDPAFISAGDGVICIWSQEGRRLMDLGSFQGTTPASITAGCVHGHNNTKYLASCYRITRQVDPNQFRLVPQNEQERRRRAEAEARESLIQNELVMQSKTIRVWFYRGHQPSMGANIIRIHNDAPVVQLENMNGKLICGDIRGCITQYTWGSEELNQSILSAHEDTRFKIVPERHRCIVALLKATNDNNILAVSIDPVHNEQSEEESLQSNLAQLHVTISRGVLLIDMQTKTLKAVLNAHIDTVRCICPLPNGDILTAGGKMDAKVLLWKENDTKDAKTLTKAKEMKEPGYVFDLQVLNDSDPTSGVFAIVGARYNMIKIVI